MDGWILILIDLTIWGLLWFLFILQSQFYSLSEVNLANGLLSKEYHDTIVLTYYDIIKVTIQ